MEKALAIEYKPGFTYDSPENGGLVGPGRNKGEGGGGGEGEAPHRDMEAGLFVQEPKDVVPGKCRVMKPTEYAGD